MTPGELREKYKHVGRQTFSFHLRVLETSGLARARRRGQSSVYRAQLGGLREISEWVTLRLADDKR